jgi:hypothetical protein
LFIHVGGRRQYLMREDSANDSRHLGQLASRGRELTQTSRNDRLNSRGQRRSLPLLPFVLWLKPHLARLREKLVNAGAPIPVAVRGVGYLLEEHTAD